MFDVTDKRAVDRLAAVVVMLERREAEARAAYVKAQAQLIAVYANKETPKTRLELAAEHHVSECARIRWTEAQSALAAARELATDR